MKSARIHPRWLLTWLGVTAAALWIADAFIGRDPVLGQGLARQALSDAAVVVSAALVVVAGAELILSRALRASGGTPTAFMRAAVYAVLTFIASFLTLRWFGLDVRTVIATSAIATAAVGFALQPTLGGVIAGLALHLDRVVRVGDGVLHEGEWVEITSLGWRAVTGMTSSGRKVVLPNARLSDAVTQVAPFDRATQAELFFLASDEIRPDLISDLVCEMMTDLPLVDEALPILVAPVAQAPRRRALRYRVKYWIRRYAQADDVQAEAHRRLWYLFQRHRLPWLATGWPGETASPPRGLSDTEVEALIGGLPGDLDARARGRLREAGELLLFAADEYLVAPPRTEGMAFVVLQGEAVAREAIEIIDEAAAQSDLYHLGRTAAVRRIGQALARYIGPYAEFAVSLAAKTAPNIGALCETVAREIDDESERAAFLAEVRPRAPSHIGAGAWLTARRDAAGALICGGGLRARRETALLALPQPIAAGVSGGVLPTQPAAV
jgi:small-conductance mechanosensitive channel